MRAGTTQRHLSFIESGRSVPGREMVIRLTESLGLPLRERNELLLAAGYAPAYPETPLDSAGLAPVLGALEHILGRAPALPGDHRGPARRAWSPPTPRRRILFDGCAAGCSPARQRVPLALHPDGMAPRIVNFAEWAWHVLNAIDRRARPQSR